MWHSGWSAAGSDESKNHLINPLPNLIVVSGFFVSVERRFEETTPIDPNGPVRRSSCFGPAWRFCLGACSWIWVGSRSSDARSKSFLFFLLAMICWDCAGLSSPLACRLQTWCHSEIAAIRLYWSSIRTESPSDWPSSSSSWCYCCLPTSTASAWSISSQR